MNVEEISWMPVFKSYMPLRADFDELMKMTFGHVNISDGQRTLFEAIFYAGASSAYSVLVNEPLQQGTVCDELADHADRIKRGEKVA